MTPQPEAIVEPEPPTYIFSARELSRLAVYRAAIVAGFYSDSYPSAQLPVRKSLNAQTGSEQNRSHRQHRQNG
jgi:hypothetical protein